MTDTPDDGSAPASSEQAALDLRTLPHGAARHDLVFDNLQRLQPGETFVIVNDHDPKPLRYQADSLWPDTFVWDYVEAGPVEWRLAITRAK